MNKLIPAILSLTLLGSLEAQAATKNYCGELANGYGPFDYRRRSEFADNFYLVEMAHFTPDVENGIKGNTSSVGGDLDYTLRAIPNHHRALATLTSLALRERTLQINGMRYPVECWFNRALRFTPDDSNVYAAYGSYLFSVRKIAESTQLFKDGLAIDPENAILNYNLGLAYLKQGKLNLAKSHAEKAYAKGYPLQGLKNRLMEANAWDR